MTAVLGRPPTGTAKGAAQLQREYRQRKKAEGLPTLAQALAGFHVAHGVPQLAQAARLP
jgi:hypothetical protein